MVAIKRIITSILFLVFSNLAHAAGNVEGVNLVGTDFRVWGWACDQAAPNQVVWIHLWRDDNVFIGAGAADLWRESAVGAACGGSSQHGFYIKITIPESLLDNKNHVVNAFVVGGPSAPQLLPSSRGSSVYFASNKQPNLPKNPGDVVGRDYQGSYVGHLGLWDGSSVIQMSGAKAGGPLPTIFFQTITSFNSDSAPWDAINPKFPSNISVSRCYQKYCTPNMLSHTLLLPQAIAARARQIWLIGADYTVSAYFTPAQYEYKQQATNPSNNYFFPLRRGMYRCDTFVIDSYFVSAFPIHDNNYVDNATKKVHNAPSGWHSKVIELHYGVILPRNVFEKIGAIFR